MILILMFIHSAAEEVPPNAVRTTKDMPVKAVVVSGERFSPECWKTLSEQMLFKLDPEGSKE